jgi:hypothetical protein
MHVVHKAGVSGRAFGTLLFFRAISNNNNLTIIINKLIYLYVYTNNTHTRCSAAVRFASARGIVGQLENGGLVVRGQITNFVLRIFKY